MQFHGGVYKISEWADIVSICPLLGMNIIESLDTKILIDYYPDYDSQIKFMSKHPRVIGLLKGNKICLK